ncbi:MAG: hypothetical protein DRI44_09215 [Chlamydiae bacterium]|nr:MAG: hypothetical protein DRI44_09215 [Chlamydiota bacterium]
MSKLLFIITIFFICCSVNIALAVRSQPIKTGQTNVYLTGDDGTYQTGYKWNTANGPRFVTNSVSGSEVAILDKLTGLIWTQNANIDGWKNWVAATNYCENLIYAGYSDWRLPNVLELKSLIDYGRYNPSIPSGHPFTAVQSQFYWSSSTYAYYTDFAWHIDLYGGFVYNRDKTVSNYVWPVRAGIR